MSRANQKEGRESPLNLLHAKRSLMLYFDERRLSRPKEDQKIEKNKDKAASFAVIGILGLFRLLRAFLIQRKNRDHPQVVRLSNQNIVGR